MTAPNDADRLVHAFLQEGPAQLSPPVTARIRGEIHETKQRATRPWRTPTMPRMLLVIAPVAAIVIAVLAMALAGSGGPKPVPSAAPSVNASAAVSMPPSAAPSPSPTAGPSPYPLAAGEAWIAQAAGDHVTLFRPDGTGRHDILRDVGRSVSNLGIRDPIWSPDGQQLTFEANGDYGSQVWIANADGTGAHAVFETPAGCFSGVCIETAPAAWSADGRTILYKEIRTDKGTFTEAAVMLLDVASGTTTEVYRSSKVGMSRFSFSPDGRSIGLVVDHYEGAVDTSSVVGSAIAVIDLDSVNKSPKEITDPGLFAGSPDWHPTEDLIVFRTNALDTNTKTLQDNAAPSDLYTIHSDGSGLTNLTHNKVRGAIVRGPTWTPDGRILFLKRDGITADDRLLISDADGSNAAVIEDSAPDGARAHWRPGT